jgi:hypothetical protein
MNDIIIPEPLRAKARELSLPDSLASDLLSAYAPFAVAGGEVKAKIAAVEVLTPALARDFRLAMVKVRTGSDKKRKDLKADSLLRGKAIDGLHALIELEASSVERQMEDIEKAAERAESARVAKLREDRLAALRPFVTDPSVYAVEKMTDSAFAELAESSKLAHESRERAKAEAEAKAKAQAEADRKLAEEVAAERAKIAAERIAAAAIAAAERREAESKAAAERAKADAEMAAARAQVEANKAELRRAEEAERAKNEAKRQADMAQAAAEAAEHHRQEQAKRIAQMEAAAAREAEQRELARVQAEARAAASKKKQEEDRAAVVARIAADLATLKKDGKIGSMTALAECIVNGGLRGVTVDWEAA